MYEALRHLAIACVVFVFCCAPIGKPGPDPTPPNGDSANQSALSAYARGNYLLEQGDLTGAERAFKQALAADPNSSRVKVRLAEVYLYQNRIHEAKRLATEVLPQFKDDPDFLIMLAKIEASMGNLESAAGRLRHVLEVDSQNETAMIMLWRMETNLGNFDAAVAILERLREKYPGAAQVSFWMGLVMESAGKYDRARIEFEKTLQLEPNHIQSMLKLGHLSLRAGDKDAAEKYFRGVLDIDPGNIEALQGMATIRGDNMDGPAPGGIDELGLRVAVELLEKGEFREALRELEPIRQKHPDNALVKFFTALAAEGLEEFERALKLYESIPEESSLHHQARFRHALDLARMKKTDRALREAEALVMDKPDMIEAVILLGNLYIEKERPDDAVGILEPASQAYPRDEGLLLTLGAAYYEAGKIDKSIETMTRLLEINPDNADALNFLGYTLAERGERLDEAELLIQKAMKLKPGSAEITDSLGWVFYQRGDYRKALVILKTAHSLKPEEPVISEHLGDAYLKIGDKKKALEYYRKALDSGPKSELKKRLTGKIKEIENK